MDELSGCSPRPPATAARIPPPIPVGRSSRAIADINRIEELKPHVNEMQPAINSCGHNNKQHRFFTFFYWIRLFSQRGFLQKIMYLTSIVDVDSMLGFCICELCTNCIVFEVFIRRRKCFFSFGGRKIKSS